MKNIIKFLSTALLLPALCHAQEKRKTIVAIFPHSDDETAVAPVLVKYARHHNVYVIYVVDVADSSRIAGYPAGDSMIKTRRAEATCACNKLGLQPPIFLGFERLDGRKGPREYFLRTKRLKPVLQHKIDSLKPDAIITFGPDGESGHFEHRVVSGIVTELILYNGWVDRYPLYYLARTKAAHPVEQLEGTGEVDKQYLTVSIPYTEADEARAFESFTCYKSQFRPSEIEEWKTEEAADKANIYYFRQFTVTTKRKQDLFQR